MIFFGMPSPAPLPRLNLPVAESTIFGTVKSVDYRSPDYMSFTVQTAQGTIWTVGYDHPQGLPTIYPSERVKAMGTPTSGDTFTAYSVVVSAIYRVNPPEPVKAPPLRPPFPYGYLH